MTSLGKKVTIIQTLAMNEENVGRLYEAYANKFPEHEEFWFGLAIEEVDHSNRVLELLNKVKKGSARIYEDRFHTDDLQRFQDNLKEQLDRVRH